MTQPPQDGQGQGYGYGYGGQQPPPGQPQQPPQQPPQTGPYGAPGPYGSPPAPGPYGGTDNPYAGGAPQPQQPQQPQQPPAYGYGQQSAQQPYGQQPYGQQPSPYGQFPPPPNQTPGGGKKKAVLIAAAVVVVAALAGGGIMLGTLGDDGKDDKPVAKESSVVATDSGSPSVDESVAESDDPATEEPTADETTDGPSERPAGDTGYQGQWQNEKAQTLTIGAKMTSGSAKGKYSVSYIDAGGKGICSGIGQTMSGDRFRIAVSCGGKDTGDKVFAANLTQASDVVTLTWDKGGTVKLPWIGG
ncbi:hypothetical protein [Streptomyces sp. VRA16 Mangrove soil]|uniref:hypothetical protein n=1 Tax=Streptomyces sp. VRA16 Mangrove soil TaxID=2817434 RepID=UPI001A9DCD0E|nr:hypothetical protein [Streptomyces sp. VRA16 Mangrove soil]MBO1337546.1 hypothetical protein [Streptomyces sp. VRA16 Mangrove soil]